MSTPRAIVDNVLERKMTHEIWSGNYDKVLPVSVQDFDITAVLPAVFYMFRFGHRRGKGRFLEVFGGKTGTEKERKRAATIERVAATLAQSEDFVGFDHETAQAILGDLLLSFCLENSRRALGRQEQIQRVAPAHYMASWVDLPESVAHLRYVPEMMVAILADQRGDYVQQSKEGEKTWFTVGQGFEQNVLLKAFNQGLVREGPLGDRSVDRFQEETEVGLDQLLMIRLAQLLRTAPEKLRGRGSERISNQRPIAEKAAHYFSEDIRRFVRAYAEVMPRHTFVELLESCIALGLTTILTSVIAILFEWKKDGQIPIKDLQHPPSLFVDCSNGVERTLQRLAEQSMDDFMRLTEYFPVILMALRLLDYRVRNDPKLKKLEIPTRPYATEWLNLLGEILHERRSDAALMLYHLATKVEELAEELQEEYAEAAEILTSDDSESSPVWRLAEALTLLQGRAIAQGHVIKLIDSGLLVSQPNGLAIKRSVMRKTESDGVARREVRSVVLSDAMLEYLVHLHVLPTKERDNYRALSLKEFIKILHDRYGLCVDEAPQGMTISNEHLQLNRRLLERRLRDLGLLVGVNDAEAMKRLKPRFTREERDYVDVD